jgi:hypothetical protein
VMLAADDKAEVFHRCGCCCGWRHIVISLNTTCAVYRQCSSAARDRHLLATRPSLTRALSNAAAAAVAAAVARCQPKDVSEGYVELQYLDIQVGGGPLCLHLLLGSHMQEP